MKMVIVDDHPLVRKGIISLLMGENGINDIKEASNSQEALNIIINETPEISMIDLRLGRESGLNIIENAKRMKLSTKFIIFSSYISQEEYLQGEKMGVDGYILKDALPEDILYAISTINRGKKYYDSGILGKNQESNNTLVMANLTDREKEVIKEIGKGLSNNEIASELFISEYTVKKHVTNILSKLNLTQRAQVVYMINKTNSFT